jgi:hypothetical protein
MLTPNEEQVTLATRLCTNKRANPYWNVSNETSDSSRGDAGRKKRGVLTRDLGSRDGSPGLRRWFSGQGWKLERTCLLGQNKSRQSPDCRAEKSAATQGEGILVIE